MFYHIFLPKKILTKFNMVRTFFTFVHYNHTSACNFGAYFVIFSAIFPEILHNFFHFPRNFLRVHY